MESGNVEIEAVRHSNSPLTIPKLHFAEDKPKKKHKRRAKFRDYDEPAPTVVYVPYQRRSQGRFPNVSVHRRADGRYVVIEQRPVATQFSDDYPKYQNFDSDGLFGGGTTYRQAKEPWQWSTKGEYIERSAQRGFHQPFLPPIKNKYEDVESKVGSLDNADHCPGGGDRKIPTFRLRWHAEPKVDTRSHRSPDIRSNASDVSSRTSVTLPELQPRYGAQADDNGFTSIHYTPGGSVTVKKKHLHVKPRVRSLENIKHKSYGGGKIKYPHYKTKWESGSRVGSLDNVSHSPTGGNVQVLSERLHWKSGPKVKTFENKDFKPRKKRFKVPHFETNWEALAESRIGSLDNAYHTPKGGNVQVFSEKLKWHAESKVKDTWLHHLDYDLLTADSDTDDELNALNYSG